MRGRASLSGLLWGAMWFLVVASTAVAGPARLKCTSEPEGATIWLRREGQAREAARKMGQTPVEFIITTVTSEERPFVLTYELEGFHRMDTTVLLQVDSEDQVHIKLIPLDQELPEAEAGPGTRRGEPDEGTAPEESGGARPADGGAGAEAETEVPSGELVPLAEAEVAFIRGSGLFVARADGGGAREVTKVARDATRSAPAWSPDGTRLAYVSGGDLWVTPLDGSPKRLVQASALRASTGFWARKTPLCLDPTWTPDGQAILFLHSTLDGFLNLYRVNADGTGIVLLGEMVAGPAAPHPTLPRLAIPYPGGVRLVDLSSLPEKRPIVAVLPKAAEPCWSPDGSRLVVVCDGELWQTNPDGGQARKLFWDSRCPVRHPVWLPDGQGLLVIASVRRTAGPRYDEVWLVPGQPGGAPRVLASGADQSGGQRAIGFLAWWTRGCQAICGFGYRPTTFRWVREDGTAGDQASGLMQPSWRPTGAAPVAPATEAETPREVQPGSDQP